MSNIDHKDAARGLYRKFKIERTDGRSEPGEKHDGCEYFVLDIDHDPHALPALKAYADSCRAAFPKLANDLDLRRRAQMLHGVRFPGEEGHR